MCDLGQNQRRQLQFIANNVIQREVWSVEYLNLNFFKYLKNRSHLAMCILNV